MDPSWEIQALRFQATVKNSMILNSTSCLGDTTFRDCLLDIWSIDRLFLSGFLTLIILSNEKQPPQQQQQQQQQRNHNNNSSSNNDNNNSSNNNNNTKEARVGKCPISSNLIDCRKKKSTTHFSSPPKIIDSRTFPTVLFPGGPLLSN